MFLVLRSQALAKGMCLIHPELSLTKAVASPRTSQNRFIDTEPHIIILTEKQCAFVSLLP